MSESEQAAAAVEEEAPAEAPEAEAPEAAPAAPAADPEEPAADGGEEIEPDPAVPVAMEPVSGRQAKVFLCDRGHRTVAVWSTPTVCHARPLRSGGECGRALYPLGELPEQVQKALNPLKASKKASKK